MSSVEDRESEIRLIVADSKNETKNSKFNMSDTKWRTFFMKPVDFAINQGTLVFWIADSKSETKNSIWPKQNVDLFCKNQWIVLKIKVL